MRAQLDLVAYDWGMRGFTKDGTSVATWDMRHLRQALGAHIGGDGSRNVHKQDPDVRTAIGVRGVLVALHSAAGGSERGGHSGRASTSLSSTSWRQTRRGTPSHLTTFPRQRMTSSSSAALCWETRRAPRWVASACQCTACCPQG